MTSSAEIHAPPSSLLLAVRDLCLERGGRELFAGLSFEVHAGQLIQIEGRNGAGKTSLLRILAGLARYGFQGGEEHSGTPLYLGHQPAVKALLTPRENLQRVQVKKMLAQWEREYPGRTETIFRSIRNVAPSQLADSTLFDFSSLKAEVDTDLHLPAINVVNL